MIHLPPDRNALLVELEALGAEDESRSRAERMLNITRDTGELLAVKRGVRTGSAPLRER